MVLSKEIEVLKVDKEFYIDILGALAGLYNIYKQYDINDYTINELANELREDVEIAISEIK